ncbi:18895_t:CDS:2 [Dentiscutata erythropus]|uniref:18895_t:CDS:1 n=1 Tax=Dentiscutata erythropus TaxID=1348616 RepID=A0A9N9C2M4_9GLOM|nr:18895_t:CDS:2 [Dentiscutata erythropus]
MSKFLDILSERVPYVTIPDVNEESFSLLLRYLYSGTLSLEGLYPAEIFDLYHAASKIGFILSITHFENN